MKTWRECGGAVLEQRQAVAEALALHGDNISRAAKALGITRRYLHMVLPTVLDEKALHALHARNAEKWGRSDNGHKQGVNVTTYSPLTCGDAGPTLDGVTTATEVETTDLKVTDFPRELKQRLEVMALERKHRLGERHASIGRTLAELLREAMDRRERGE